MKPNDLRVDTVYVGLAGTYRKIHGFSGPDDATTVNWSEWSIADDSEGEYMVFHTPLKTFARWAVKEYTDYEAQVHTNSGMTRAVMPDDVRGFLDEVADCLKATRLVKEAGDIDIGYAQLRAYAASANILREKYGWRKG